MTDSTPHTPNTDTKDDLVSVPENPTQDELKSSLEQAEFPRAEQMSKEIFGENPRK